MPLTTPAERHIRARIAQAGAITFAEFMRIALYHPGGYYPNRAPIGAGGDYFTSPAAHPAFGALICVQLRQMWQTLDRPNPFWAIECGAGDGILANDITAYARHQFPDFAPALRYVAIDRAPAAAHAIQSHTIPIRNITGCILSNELIDAFPVHRFQIANGRPREILVTLDEDGNFVERLSEPTTPIIEERIAAAGRPLPDGFRGEVNPFMGEWIASASAALERGYALTIDYGYEAPELYSHARRHGTLQTYYRHTDASSPYQRIGRQDLTAHADFTALIQTGRAAGINPVFLTTQAEFLHTLGINQIATAIRDSNLPRAERLTNLQAMSRLIDPTGLGKFHVLVQHKNTGLTHSNNLIPPTNQIAHLRPPTPY